MPMNMRSLLQPLALTGLSLALAACVSSAPPVAKPPVDTTTPAQRLAAVDAAAGPDDKELSVQPLRDSQVEDLRVTAQTQRQANDLAGAASSLDHALEIVASLDHARAGLMGASVTGKPIWLALTVDDGDGTKLRSGEPLADVAPLITEFGPQAVLVNCSLPEAADQSMPILAGFGLPFGAYANGFTCIHSDFNSIYATADILEKRTDLTPQAYLTFAQGWARAGATIIGGCCEIGPAHIAALAQGL